MRVPGKGLRYLRASDLANGVDYVGQVRCRSGNESIQGSALLFWSRWDNRLAGTSALG